MPMKKSTINRFFTNALRTLGCVSALTACSAWANVITLQPSSSSVVAPIDLSSSYTNSARGIDAAGTDTSNQVLFQTAAASTAATETSSAPVLNSALAATNTQESAATQPQVSVNSAAAPEQAQPSGGAIAAAFDEEFVSVPTVQFATVSAPNASGPSTASVTAVPELSAFFPIIGLIAAVSCTQILRRRRAVQKTAPIA